MSEDRNIPSDNGRAPPFDRAAHEHSDTVGDGDGYSGQEYDNAGQRAWREKRDGAEVAPDGEVSGSGVSAGGGNDREEFDNDVATGGGERPPEGN